jgi:hypothetical protein
MGNVRIPRLVRRFLALVTAIRMYLPVLLLCCCVLAADAVALLQRRTTSLDRQLGPRRDSPETWPFKFSSTSSRTRNYDHYSRHMIKAPLLSPFINIFQGRIGGTTVRSWHHQSRWFLRQIFVPFFWNFYIFYELKNECFSKCFENVFVW